MKVTRRPRRQGPLIRALYVNAGLMAAILAVLLFRGGGASSRAFGAPEMAPIAGGGGVFLMPAQFSINTWGCYLMDIDSQNICAYQYSPSDRQLRFVASRNYREDRKLKDWNTSPHPAEIAHLVEVEKSQIRGEAAPGAGPAPDALPPVPVAPPAPVTPAAPDSTSPSTAPAGPVPGPSTVPSTGPMTTTNPWALPGQPVPGGTPGNSTRPTDEKSTLGHPATNGQELH